MVSLKNKNQSGFTIVELLIVIVIIGILAGLVITQVIGATAKARDTERKTDVDQIANQLEAYYARNGGYPAIAANATGDQINNPAWRKGNEFSAGDGAKSFADPSASTNTTLALTDVSAIGSYSYVPAPSGCVSPTSDTAVAATSGTFCDEYKLSAWLENDKKIYSKTNANN